MVFFGTFFAVVTMLFNIAVHVPRSSLIPVSYRLTLSHVETAICGPPATALSPYLQFLCGTLDVAQLPAAVAPSAAVNAAALFGATVFDPSLTGCLVNCTAVVDEPAPVYFGPHLPLPGPVIIAPKFELLAPPTPRSPPVCKPEDRPFSYYDLLTLENLVYLGIALLAVYTLWCSLPRLRAFKRELLPLFEFEDYGIYVPSVGSDLDLLFEDGPTDFSMSAVESNVEDVVEVADEVIDVVLAVGSGAVSDVALVAADDDEEPAVIEERPQQLPQVSIADELPVVDSELSVVEDELVLCPLVGSPIAHEVTVEVVDQAASIVSETIMIDDNVVVDEEPASSQPTVPVITEDEPNAKVSHAPTMVESEALLQDPASSAVQGVDGESAEVPGTAEDVEQPVKRKRPARSGRKCKALARKREREAAAAAATANPEASQSETEQPAQPPVVEKPLTRDERRARRGRAHAVVWEAGPSMIISEPEGPVFTDDDFPPLPVEPVAPRPLKHGMSYALITAVSPPSATAAIHHHLRPLDTRPVEVDAHPLPEPPRLKWIAASRQYEATPKDSVWTNWTLDLEDIATFRPARNTRRKKKD